MPAELLIIGILVIVSVGLIIHALLPGAGERKQTVLRRMRGKHTADDAKALQKKAKESAAKRFAAKVAPHLGKPGSEQTINTLRVKLANAGLRHESYPALFVASKTVLGLGLGALTFLLAAGSGHAMPRVLGLAAILGGIGFVLPDIWLWLATKQRAEKISHGLPDSLDLLVISVEAGLGLDAAIQRVGDEMKTVHPELCEEFTIATLETQMGVPRGEALQNMATRTAVAEMRSLVAVITQAERFGTSVAKALRSQADALRVKRRQAAEERAQKTAVKLMGPLILFIFPAIFVVLAGPAALKLIRTLGQSGLTG
jgi:tight adherence protein C